MPNRRPQVVGIGQRLLIASNIGRQIVGSNLHSVAHHDGPLNGVVELTNIALPGIGHQETNCFTSRAGCFLSHGSSMFGNKKLDQLGHVIQPFSKSRNLDLDSVQAIEQFFLKSVCGDFLNQIPCGGRNNPCLGAIGFVSPQRGDFLILDCPE